MTCLELLQMQFLIFDSLIQPLIWVLSEFSVLIERAQFTRKVEEAQLENQYIS